MEKFKIIWLEYFWAVALLTLVSAIGYLNIPENPNYEVFSYIFGGGLMLYAIHFLIVFLMELIFKIRKDSLATIIFSIILFEVILIIFSGSSLIISFFDKKNTSLYLMFQLPLLIIRVIPLFYRKFRVFRRSEDSKDC